MNRIFGFGLIAAYGSVLHAQTINVHGKISDGTGKAVANAVVELTKSGARDTTGSDGVYSLTKTGVPIGRPSPALPQSMSLADGVLEFRVGEPAPLQVEVYDVQGNLQNKESLSMAQAGAYHFKLSGASRSNQVLIIRASIGRHVQTFRYLSWQQGIAGGNFTSVSTGSGGGRLAKTAAAVDTLQVSATGFVLKQLALATYDTTLNVTLEPDVTKVYNPCPTNGSACKILPFGDSITRGAKSSDDGGYRTPLYKLILAAKQKATFTGSAANGPSTVSGQPFPRAHEGHAGWTIDPGFNMLSSSYSGISKLVPSPALDANPNIILLMIGTNDLFARETANMATRLEALLDKIVLNAPNALIVLAQITPLEKGSAALTAYNAKIPGIVQTRAAKGQHIIGVDMSKLPISQLSDGTHPNDQGYAYMADIWYAAIKDLLPK